MPYRRRGRSIVGPGGSSRLASLHSAGIFRFIWPSSRMAPRFGRVNWHPRSTATMPHLSRVDRVRGCLLGLAVGDALGAPLEGLSSQQIKSHYGRVRNYVDGVQAWKRKPYRWRLRGLYSDDTQQALALCDILLDHGRVDQLRLADLYLALATPKGSFVGAHRGIGRSFRQGLASLERGVPAHLVGQCNAGIGAAMRIAPVPLYFGDDRAAMFDAVMDASLMTHRDIRSLSGALAVAHGIRRLAAGEPRDPSMLLWVAS